MADLEHIANDSEWQTSSKEPVSRTNIKDTIAEPMPDLLRFKEIWLEVWQLENGLFYGVVKDERGRNIIVNRSYQSKDRESAEEAVKPTEGYVPFYITKRLEWEMHGFFATFLYHSGPAPDGFPEAKIEYTTWHAPARKLTMLLSVHASQGLPDGRLDLAISPDSWSLERAMQMKINVTGDAEGELKFDKSGRLDNASQGGLYAVIRSGHPLYDIYFQTSDKRSQIDVLGTAVAIINGFPVLRPLDMRQLVKYK